MPRRRPVRLAQPEPRPLVPAEALARLGATDGDDTAESAPPHPSGASITGRAPRHDAITPARKRRFIEVLAATGSVSEAARQVGASRQSFYALRSTYEDEIFLAAWDRALSAATDILANVAYERAIEGVEEPVFWRGELVGTRRRYNDRLLMQLLRVRNPSGYAPLSDQRGWYTEIVEGAEPSISELLDAIAPSTASSPPGSATKRAD
ncbi:hypothetical protein [Sphingomonas oryzagri]|uniref:Uncharacterized protein n=1 Tax=Sphingomonas oryzagri TaxID=3042314 RepID=A0ABT6N775_9SPHN|nr:hypothetical protein [Sphingomonas oryzagri]MDH7640962.1 hypothetical protein [Sphingomonas oryzagri]